MKTKTKTRPAKLPVAENVVAELTGDKFVIAATIDGARFHFWMTLDFKLDGETLYKQPPAGSARIYPSRLDATSGPSAAKVEAMMEAVNRGGLIHKARADHEAKIQRAREDHAATVAGNRVREAGPALLAALKIWQKFARDNLWTDADHHFADGRGWISITDEAIAQAEGLAKATDADHQRFMAKARA